MDTRLYAGKSRAGSALALLLGGLSSRAVDALPALSDFFFAPRARAAGRPWGSPLPGGGPGAAPGRFSGEAAAFRRLFKLYRRLNAIPAFGDLPHPPRHRGKPGAGRLRIGVAAAGGLPRLRGAADFGLYSPGGPASLLLDAPGGAARRQAEALAAYALVKAGARRRRLRLGLETGGPAGGRRP